MASVATTAPSPLNTTATSATTTTVTIASNTTASVTNNGSTTAATTTPLSVLTSPSPPPRTTPSRVTSATPPITTITPSTTTSPQLTTAATTLLGMSMSNTILILVFTGCTALILLVLLAICCRLLCIKTKRQCEPSVGDKRLANRTHSTNPYADPYRIVENHYHSNDVTRLYATPELTYAKPEIYSTFINPSFYEDVYARWKLQEQARNDYDSPWQYSRRLKDQMDTPDFKWSVNSLRALDNYDYDRYGQIPRGKISSESEKEDTETFTTETPGFTTF